MYGDARDLPVIEETEPRPLSAYGTDKLGCELHARAARLCMAFPTVVCGSSTCMARARILARPYSGVISIFSERIRRGAPIDIFGDGAQTRDFVYVGDAVGALLAAMRLRPGGAPVFNVCSGHATSVLGLAQLIGALTGVQPDVRHAPARAGEIRHSTGSPALAGRILGLPEPLRLRDGLFQVIGWLDASG